jgi:hypothetical protein
VLDDPISIFGGTDGTYDSQLLPVMRRNMFDGTALPDGNSPQTFLPRPINAFWQPEKAFHQEQDS